MIVVFHFIRVLTAYAHVQITVQSAADVQAALAFSKFTGIRLSVKNKGHDFLGRSSGQDTLSLWVSVRSSFSTLETVN